MTTQSDTQACTHSGCDEPATRTIGFQMRYLNREFVGHYCDEHADGILHDIDPGCFPGAREITNG